MALIINLLVAGQVYLPKNDITAVDCNRESAKFEFEFEFEVDFIPAPLIRITFLTVSVIFSNLITY